jgi:hypothetical protein
MFMTRFRHDRGSNLSSKIRLLAGLSFLVFALATPLLAQNHLQGGVPAAGSGPAFDLSAGYTYLTMAIPTASSANLNGVDADARMDFNRRWGAAADASYVRASNVLGGHGSYVMTFLIGPVFYPFEGRNTRLSLRALGGAGLVDSIVPVNSTTYLHGWVARPSYALGVGIERSIVGPFALRADGDYLRTAFVNSSYAVQPQNNVRLTLSVVFHVKQLR